MNESNPEPNPSQADWNKPLPEVLPRATWWPAAIALGATLICWGLITSIIVVVIGLIIFAASLAGWIGEIRHEQKEH